MDKLSRPDSSVPPLEEDELTPDELARLEQVRESERLSKEGC